MLLDDLDFFLLDIATEYSISLDRFNRIELCYFLNRNVPPYGFDELKLALAEMFQRGDAVARIEWPHRRNSRTFIPTLDEIEAGLRGAFILSYRLTPEGGARWESAVEADWSLYVSWGGSERYCWRETQSREYLEYIIEIDLAEGRIPEEICWKELRPWQPLYWKTLPRGYQARYRTTAMRDRGESFHLAGIAPPPWGQEVTPRFHRGPKGLTARKLRHPQLDDAGPQHISPPNRKPGLPHIKNERRMFAAACRYVRSADTETLLKVLDRPFGEARFASVRQLAERRESAAILPLTALVLRKQYLPALWALGEIADERTLQVLELLLECDAPGRISPGGSWGGFLVRAIAGFGQRALPMLEKMLASENVSAARGAVQVLGLIQTERSKAVLENARQLECESKKRRIFWHIDTARREDQVSRPRRDWAAIRRLHDVARLTGEAVDGLTTRDAIKALVATLNHPEPIRRRASVDLLVDFGVRNQIREIEKLASDSEWQVRASVAFALRRLNGSREQLRVLAEDMNLVVRWLATNDIIPYES